MREFTCIVCGAKGIDRSFNGVKMFCSEKCREKHRGEKVIVCEFNEGVLCTSQRCDTCGWNPAVEKRRKERMGR